MVVWVTDCSVALSSCPTSLTVKSHTLIIEHRSWPTVVELFEKVVYLSPGWAQNEKEEEVKRRSVGSTAPRVDRLLGVLESFLLCGSVAFDPPQWGEHRSLYMVHMSSCILFVCLSPTHSFSLSVSQSELLATPAFKTGEFVGTFSLFQWNCRDQWIHL